MSVSSKSYAELRRLVVSGALQPGRAVAEIPLAEQLGVSRPTVREALRRLEGDGLVRNDGRGLRVAHMDAAEIRSASLMRAALEALHAELAAQRCEAGEIAPAQLRRIAIIADDADRHTRDGSFEQAMRDNRAFHQAIDELADSPVSAHATDRLWDRILVSAEASVQRADRADVVDREHRTLLTAIADGDVGAAGVVARDHVLGTLTESSSVLNGSAGEG
jgi:DNA-binding GntR family transcriptional regulator